MSHSKDDLTTEDDLQVVDEGDIGVLDDDDDAAAFLREAEQGTNDNGTDDYVLPANNALNFDDSAPSDEAPNETNTDDVWKKVLQEHVRTNESPLDVALNHTLLTAEEELSLLRRVAAGKKVQKVPSLEETFGGKIRQVGDKTLLTFETGRGHKRITLDPDKVKDALKTGSRVADIVLTTRDAQEAEELLMRHNYRRVISIAQRYGHSGLSPEDLFQEGVMGLQKAIRRYDVKKTNEDGNPMRLSTYATPWIQQGISRSVRNQGRTIRIPTHLHDTIRSLGELERKYRENNGRTPTDDTLFELARDHDVKNSAGKPLTLDVIKMVRRLYWDQARTSLSQTNSSGEELTLLDITPDTSDLGSPDLAALAYNDKQAINLCLNKLPRREADILMRLNGLGNYHTHTLVEIREVFGLTKEGIRQIKLRAETKLKALLEQRATSTFVPPDKIRNLLHTPTDVDSIAQNAKPLSKGLPSGYTADNLPFISTPLNLPADFSARLGGERDHARLLQVARLARSRLQNGHDFVSLKTHGQAQNKTLYATSNPALVQGADPLARHFNVSVRKLDISKNPDMPDAQWLEAFQEAAKHNDLVVFTPSDGTPVLITQNPDLLAALDHQ